MFGGARLADAGIWPMRFALAALIVWPVSVRAETFREVLDQVAAKHPKITAAKHLTDAGRADVANARSSYRPQFGIETDVGWIDGSSTRSSGIALLPEAKLSQLVYDGGRTPAEIRRRKLRVDLLGVQERAALSDISLQLAQAWIDYARAT